MGAILNNQDAEALILDIRAGHQAEATMLDGGSGTWIVFPTTVIVDRPGRGQAVFPLRTAMEPGSLCRQAGQSAVTAVIDDVTVEGHFTWTLSEKPGAGEAEPASYRFLVEGRPVATPAWAHQLPRSLSLPRRSGAQLLRDRERLVRQGHLAEHWLLVLSQRVMESCCRGPLGRVLATRRLIQDEDIVQRGLQTASRLLPIYASPRRPPRSWVGMIQLDAKRDMHREVSQLDWLPRELSAVVDRARVAGIGLDPDPTVTLAALIDASLEAGQPLPRATAHQVQAALRTPDVVALDAPARPWPGSQPLIDVLGGADPAFEAIDDHRGEAVAVIARLVVDDQDIVRRAFLGDPVAIRIVADRVVATLRLPEEPLAGTRRRCRDQFRATGQLFSADEAWGHFPDLAPSDLGALDTALRAAIGLEFGGRGIEGDGESPDLGGEHDFDD